MQPIRIKMRYCYDRWIVKQYVKGGVSEENIKQEFVYLHMRRLSGTPFQGRKARRFAHRLWKWVYAPVLADL